MIAGLKTALALGAAAAVAVAPAAASPGPPRIHQLVVFRDGSFKEKSTRARQVRVRVGRKDLEPMEPRRQRVGDELAGARPPVRRAFHVG